MNGKTFVCLSALLLGAHGASPQANAAPLATAGDLIVNLHASAIHQANGTPIAAWSNFGDSTVGAFAQATGALQPTYRTNIQGSSAVEFNGFGFLLSAGDVPGTVHGNNPWTMETWINNPDIQSLLEEVYFQWGRRDGPNGSNAHAIYWEQDTTGGAFFSAISHWGPDDMSWGEDGVQDPSRTPLANVWHHVAITFDGSVEKVYVDGTLRNQEFKNLIINQGKSPLKFALGGAAYGGSAGGRSISLGYTGYIAALRMHTGALTADQVASNFQAGIAAVPEPASSALLAMAMCGAMLRSRRRPRPTGH